MSIKTSSIRVQEAEKAYSNSLQESILNLSVALSNYIVSTLQFQLTLCSGRYPFLFEQPPRTPVLRAMQHYWHVQQDSVTAQCRQLLVRESAVHQYPPHESAIISACMNGRHEANRHGCNANFLELQCRSLTLARKAWE